MPSPWVDLLYLHGYIIDPRLSRRQATFPSTMPRPKRNPENTHCARETRRCLFTSLRLCLGIGDGVLRSQ
jgi:hypothetical protein